MKRYGLYAAAICTAAVVGVGGCAATAKADSTELQSETAVETTKEESTTVVEPVSGAIESADGGCSDLRPGDSYGGRASFH